MCAREHLPCQRTLPSVWGVGVLTTMHAGVYGQALDALLDKISWPPIPSLHPRVPSDRLRSPCSPDREWLVNTTLCYPVLPLGPGSPSMTPGFLLPAYLSKCLWATPSDVDWEQGYL
uniref:Uncharacterized protein n=1 Tax=Eutreptiella gymnastica TaxID=73025 RepID=A0A7S1J2U3_9EUGL